MEVTINGGYLPYLYIVVLKALLFFLGRPAVLRGRSARRGASATANALIEIYCALTAFIDMVLSFSTWILAIYVAYTFSILAGIVFFLVGFLGRMIISFVLPIGFAFNMIGHIVSLFATPYLVFLTLRSLSII